jgi:hypothetical protein
VVKAAVPPPGATALIDARGPAAATPGRTGASRMTTCHPYLFNLESGHSGLRFYIT